MGCCVSTNGISRNSRKKQNFQLGSDQSLKPKFSIQESRAPPEEETVKEVLSETPKLKPPIKNSLPEHHVVETNIKNQIHIDQTPFLAGDEKKIKNQVIFQEEEEETIITEQEVSEVCSLSTSETVSTTTFNNDKREDRYYPNNDEEEVNQRVKRSPVSRLPKNRPVYRNFGPNKDRVVGKSPTRRTDQSPDKRNNIAGRGDRGGGAMRLVQSKESSNYQAGRRGLRSDTCMKDPSELSGRRSRSPATRSIMGRTQSARTNGSPGRLGKDPTECGGRVESGVDGKCASNSSNPCGTGTGTSTATTTANESLENPLVSLECFIFL